MTSMNDLESWFRWMKSMGRLSTKGEAAALIGIPEPTLRSYMNGARRPSRERAVLLEKVTRATGQEVSRRSWDPE